MHSANVLQMGRRLDFGPLLLRLRRYIREAAAAAMCKTSLNIGGIYNINFFSILQVCPYFLPSWLDCGYLISDKFATVMATPLYRLRRK